jgi:predicted 2-oxoglutarate/Fe(II)-dependent dioxygenase YbiX
MYSLTKLTKDVYYFQNIIQNPELIINSIDEWKTVVNRDKSFSWDTKSLTDKEINPILKKACSIASTLWITDHGFSISDYHEMPNLVIWKRGPGFGMSPHQDEAWSESSFDKVAQTLPVSLTVLAYFSKDFEGGEITFPDLKISIKPEAGSILVFKGNEMHALNPVLKGIRTVGSLFYLNRWMYNKFISRIV